MRTVLLLIRHAAIDGLGVRLVGRESGVHLNDAGKMAAEELANRIAGISLDAIYTSPRERALETAGPIAKQMQTSVAIDESLDEIDFGSWTGKAFRDLHVDPEWQAFNSMRTGALVPGGETMIGLSARVKDAVERIRKAHEGGNVALVSHADWIRAAAAACLQLTLDEVRAFDVLPASVGVLQNENDSWLMKRWNDTGPLPTFL